MAAIQFLTRPARNATTSARNSSCSRLLGVSMLIDAINHRKPSGATESTVASAPLRRPAPSKLDDAEIRSPGMARAHPAFCVGAALLDLDGHRLRAPCSISGRRRGDGFYDVSGSEPSLK
jgi:catechol 1,2-dioxygenase